ncbi:helix-turn-helix domain-containing protein [Candidatus Williamhamiltonella defendens]|uniref:Transcriptional regulator n=1 Tax=Candidatus Hamiltonella defensa (Bemisia tabaci) TaxID=672795 RepID=A0A249DZC4_9ENTR|nr:helix-turn-helix domain-containing protein [Candidatus Hamiltonella defensa]ASX26888.1 transcriptional regulator [Candidatus Hamiltonella defensa (Bemisia tabaci)]CED79701.1 Invasion protein InvF [Candidatus Hamiltonella defensa (Bemisia tabaci)]
MKIKNIQNVLNERHKKQITKMVIWFVQIGKIECKIQIQTASGNNSEMVFKSGWRGFVAINPSSLQIQSGSLRYKRINVMMMAKLQAFIDKSLVKKSVQHISKSNEAFAVVEVPDSSILHSLREIEYWLLGETLNPKSGTDQFLNLLRNTEWYWVVYFLLNEFNGNNRLKNLCQRYGLSLAHFRRICRIALGNTTKVALRDWRMVKAILDLVLKNQNLTEVAFEHGYASLSHFSSEVKEALGVSPKKLLQTITHTTN